MEIKNSNYFNSKLVLFTLLIYIGTIIYYVLYYMINYDIRRNSVSMIVYHFIFNNIITNQLNFPEIISLFVFLLFALIVLVGIYFLYLKNKYLGTLFIILYLLSLIPWIDTHSFGI